MPYCARSVYLVGARQYKRYHVDSPIDPRLLEVDGYCALDKRDRGRLDRALIRL